MKRIMDNLSLANEQTAAFYLELLWDIDDDMSTSHVDLHNFFRDFYMTLYNKPISLGIESFDKICFENGEFHSKSKEFKRIKDKVIKPISDFLDLIYKIASLGVLSGDTITGDKALLEKFLKTGKRQKRKLLEGVAQLGVSIQEDDESVRITCSQNPGMIRALHLFALQCSQNNHEAGEMCFRMCDFQALDTQFKPSIEVILNRLYKNEEFDNMSMLHRMMEDNDFEIRYVYEPHVLNFEVRYTNKAIKSSALMAFILDLKASNPLKIRLRFIATSRIVPIIHHQPLNVQEDFYKTSFQCSGCGWCKNQKGLLKPSLLKMDTNNKTICWYDVNEYDSLDREKIEMIMGYVNMHLELVG